LKILILDQGRQALPFFKSLANSGHEVICVCNTRLSESFFSRYPTKRLIWPSYATDRQAFEEKLIDFIKKNKIDVTLSVGDISADILSRNKDEFSKYTHLTQPDYSKFIKAADKLNLMNYCLTNSLPCPKTFCLNEENIIGIADRIDFPVIVKPTRGVGAVGLVKFNTPNDLLKQYKLLENKYGPLIVQEYIPPQENGMQYQAEAFLDKNGKMKVCMVLEKPRYFPVNGGTSTANVTINYPEIVKITKLLLEGLKWEGAADVDFMLDPRDNTPKILEINPRVTAGIKIGFAAGIDFADLHLKLAFDQDIPEIANYKIGVYSRNVFLEILWFIFSNKEMKRKTQPPFFKFFGENMVDQTLSLDDPLAGLGFFLHMIKKYINFSNFTSKFIR
jgi:D-aspartate ligase